MRKPQRHVTSAVAGFFLLTLGLLAAGGCANEEPLRSVRFATRGPDGKAVAMCANLEWGEQVTGCFAGRAAEANQSSYEMPLWPGTWLNVEVRDRKDDPNAARVEFSYLYRGDEAQPLTFGFSGPVPTLNGEPVCLDLRDPNVAEWMRSQPPDRLKGVCSVRLGEDRGVNLDTMRRFACSGLVLDLESNSVAPDDKELVEAVVAVRPAGLVARNFGAIQGWLPRLTNLSHLAVGDYDAGQVRLLRDAPSLRFLFLELPWDHFDPNGQRAVSLEPLSELHQLRSLRLVSCQGVRGFSPLARLRGLRSLALEDAEHLQSVSTLSSLHRLEALTMEGTGELESLSGIEDFRDLRFLAILRLPKGEAALTPVTHLKRLKFLIVKDDDLKERKGDLDQVRQALPSVQIIGVCMGSGWPLLVLPAGALGGMAYRRLWHRAAGR